MVLAASAADEKAEPGLYILEPHSGAEAGDAGEVMRSLTRQRKKGT